MFRHQIGQRLLARPVARQEPLPFDHYTPIFQETAEIVDRNVVDIGRVIPSMGQLFGYRHLAAKHMGDANAPLCEIGE